MLFGAYYTPYRSSLAFRFSPSRLFYLTTSPENLARRNISSKNPSPAQLQQWLKDHNYDKPRTEQFRDHMVSLATFNFGKATPPVSLSERRFDAGPDRRLLSAPWCS
jgi:ABC-type dipeptide/oligopeptide/nickel transport system permease component